MTKNINKGKKVELKKFRFNKSIDIGSPDAESDDILLQVFVENDALTALLNMNSQKSILIGRTGSGKTAILKYLEENSEKNIRINPEAMSLRFLSNSTILNHFDSLGVNLNFFYKILWKHIFIIELLKLYFDSPSDKKNKWFDDLIERIKPKKTDRNIEKALNYLKSFKDDFWADTEVRIKEFEDSIAQKYSQSIGIPLEKVNIGLSAENTSSSTIKSEYKHKAESVINETKADEIFDVINIMSKEIFNDKMRKYFIIIDDLDKDWIASERRYDLIGAMIEVIKEFHAFKGVKIVIALRENLNELVFAGFKNKGGQREKFKPLYANIEWTEKDLEELVEKRLNVITENNIAFKEAFAKIEKDKSTTFKYIIERSFMRPRDIISYLNHAIENANNKSYFTLDIIKKAEISYSKERLQAIEDEWGENYGEVKNIIKFLVAKYNGFKLRNIKEDDFIEIFMDEDYQNKYKGELLLLISKWKKSELKFNQFLREIIFILYRMGILGIKKGPTYGIQFSYEKESMVDLNDINSDCKCYVHKTFYSALSINTKELEENSY